MHAHQRAFAEGGREARYPPVEGLGQDFADLAAHIGIETVARNEDEGRDEAVELVAPDEQPRARPLFETQDALRHFGEHIGIDLEQFIARKAFEDGDRAPCPNGRRVKSRVAATTRCSFLRSSGISLGFCV